MTLAQLSTVMRWPDNKILDGDILVATWVTIDAAGEYAAVVLCAKEDMTISHVGWLVAGPTGSPTADTRIETVAADGTPSGTLWAANTNLVSGALSEGFNLFALTASASISRGQLFAVKILYNSGTSFFTRRTSGQAAFALPYQVTNVSGSAVKSSTTGQPVIALGSNSTTFYPVPGIMPAASMADNAFNNTNSAARGMRFQIPFKCRCVGLSFFDDAMVGDFNAVLYDDAGSELSSSSTAFDGDAASGASLGPRMCIFDSPVTLSPATWYRAAIEPSSATNQNISTITLPSADYRSGTMGGTNHHYATRASAVWDDSNTSVIPMMDILIDQLDDGASAGGGGLKLAGRGGLCG